MEILRYRAFTPAETDDRSGNPAGVVLDAEELSEEDMLRTAAALGFSETAFLTAIAHDAARVRYFTPRAEIAFCGHATIASGVALAQRREAAPVVHLTTNAGLVPVEVTAQQATLVAVDTQVDELDDGLLDQLLGALRLDRGDLDPVMRPALVHGGNLHPLVPVRAGVLARLDHDGDALLRLQDAQGWDGTVPVVHRSSATRFASRNPFPRGGIREDPATGSAAAGLGAYLRTYDHLAVPATFVVDQGAEVGRPSRLVVEVPREGRVRVTGTAAEM
jgi:PhzF family phenazine biosynthesis protein